MKITKSLISKIYNYSSRTLSNMVEEEQEIKKFWGTRNTVFSIRQQRILFTHLGVPVLCDPMYKDYINKVLSQ